MNRFALVSLLALLAFSAFGQTPTRVRRHHHRARRRHPFRQVPRGRDLKLHLAPTSPSPRRARARGAQRQVCRRHRDQQGRQDDRGRGPCLIRPQAKPGHFPWDLLAGIDDDQRQPRWHRASERGGNEITLNYEGGSQKVLVPPGTPIVAFDPGSRADLKRGEWIWTNAPGRRQDRGGTPQREQGWRQAASLRLYFLHSFAASCASAQTRVRGTITAVDGNAITVNGKERVLIGEKTEIVFTRPISLADIKPGDFLGVRYLKRPDGTLVAHEVRRFPSQSIRATAPSTAATTRR